jgi:hypothetical protein
MMYSSLTIRFISHPLVIEGLSQNKKCFCMNSQLRVSSQFLCASEQKVTVRFLGDHGVSSRAELS